MRVGVIGLGSIGNRHSKNLLAMGHEVVGMDNAQGSTPWIAKGQAWAHSLLSLIDHRLDAVLICTPAATHADVARELLGAGYSGPLFCEKPLALSVAECEVFRSWPSPVTMVGYNLRFHPLIQRWKAMGEWTDGSFHVFCDNTKYGNHVFELSHEIDLALYFGVTPSPRQLHGTELFYLRRWSLFAPKCEVSAEFHAPDQLGEAMYVDELAHFLACVEKQEPTITPFADGIRVVEVCEQAMRMAKATA